MLSTTADLDGLPPSQVNNGRLKDLFDGKAKSHLTDVSQTNRWDLAHAMLLRESASMPMIFSRLREGKGNRTSRAVRRYQPGP